jgi:hypothetical protein
MSIELDWFSKFKENWLNYLLMNNLQKLMINLGVEPNVALAALVLLFIFLIAITILYICVPFFLLRIRKEIIEINKNLRVLYILQAQRINENNKVVSDEDKHIYEKKSSKVIKKFQLNDEDIKKLKALGYKVEK